MNDKYYNENAQNYIEDTMKADMSVQYGMFEEHLQKDATILDVGFGSGRDSLYFLQKYVVYSLDPVEAFINYGKKIGLKNIIHSAIEDITFDKKFDGIWACASLLHVQEEKLGKVFKKCEMALKEEGVMYASFKYGDFIGITKGRYFVSLTEKTIIKYLSETNFKVLNVTISEDVRPMRTDKWLNVILKLV